MKSLAELEQIRKKTLERVTLRKESDSEDTRIVVGMATCGIAAGARPVLKALMDVLEKRQVKNAYVTQTGCIGMCKYEPIVEVFAPDGSKVTYVHMTPEKAVKVINDHIVNGKVVTEYTVGAADK